MQLSAAREAAKAGARAESLAAELEDRQKETTALKTELAEADRQVWIWCEPSAVYRHLTDLLCAGDQHISMVSKASTLSCRCRSCRRFWHQSARPTQAPSAMRWVLLG